MICGRDIQIIFSKQKFVYSCDEQRQACVQCIKWFDHLWGMFHEATGFASDKSNNKSCSTESFARLIAGHLLSD
jgi:hypothetical protein